MPVHPVALCITDLNPGGAERCLVELAVRLDPAHFTPEVYCLAAPPASGREGCVVRLKDAGIPIHFLRARRAIDFPITLRRLTHELQVQRPEILQTFLFHANVLGRLAGWAAGVPVVVSGIRVAQRHGGPWRPWIERLTDGLVARHVCVSQDVAEFSRTRGHLPKRKLAVIPNGIDLTQYPGTACDLRSLGLAPGHEAVTFVGRLDHQKGLDWLLDSCPTWLARATNHDLLLVGDGPEHARLERQSATLGVSNRVHFVGHRSDVREILAASRLLVLPSRWEGMPNVILEAMASGLPVVSSDVEGVREVLGPHAASQVVAFGDREGLTNKITALIQGRDLAAQLGQSNRVRVEQAFTIQSMVRKYEALWSSLL